MKVFLIGGAGFIGSQIARELLKLGDEVIIYDAFLNFVPYNKTYYYDYLKLRMKYLKDKVTVIRGDVRSKGLLLRSLKKHRPDAIIHLAALPIATTSDELSEDAKEINLDGTINLLECMRECDFVKRFIYTSSSMRYGNFNYVPADEEHPTNPIGIYGGTKLAGEILTKSYAKHIGFNYTIIIPSAVYGPTDSNRRVSQIFIENALKGKPLRLDGGGLSKLDFTYVEDIAHGFVLALKSDKAINQTFNITCGNGRSLKEFVDVLKTIIPNLKCEMAPPDKSRPERGTLDIGKAKRLLRFEPKYQIEEGIRKYVEFIKNSGVIL